MLCDASSEEFQTELPFIVDLMLYTVYQIRRMCIGRKREIGYIPYTRDVWENMSMNIEAVSV